MTTIQEGIKALKGYLSDDSPTALFFEGEPSRAIKLDDLRTALKALEDQQLLELGRVFGMDKAEEGITKEQARNLLESLHNWLLARSQAIAFKNYSGLMAEYAAGLWKILARFNK